ncbi:nickel-binding protein [Promineifilum sp.]|uniref:nickel-binding protein n=1 Tax=Promineifilum sp. TaxID=2664178 RepID=UPI0035B0831D
MDRHFIEGATAHAVANAHTADLALQDKYHVQFLTYWFDEARSTAFCLVDSPDQETIRRAHNEAHGLVPHEILEVDPSVVEAFLGRVKDPTPNDPATLERTIDSAFRVIMFTDLKDSTLMTATLGDAKALHLLHIHNALTRNALRAHRGREIKHTGDGIMASFISVSDAIAAAIAVQTALADHNRHHPEDAIFLRIGLASGEPIEEHGDLFGHAVQLAARLCAHAKPGQIVVSQEVRDLASNEDLLFDDLGLVSLKGFREETRVFSVSRLAEPGQDA